VLHYTSKNRYDISKGKKFIINLTFQSHQKRLNRLIEQSGFRKKCSKCGREFPITPKYFYKDHGAKHGVRNDCVQCHKQKKKDSYHQKRKCSESITTIEEEDLISEEYENVIQE